MFCGHECVGGCMHEWASRGRNFISWYFVQIWMITESWYTLWWLCLLVIGNRSLFDYWIYFWWLDLFGDRKYEPFLELIPFIWWWWRTSSLVLWLGLLEMYLCYDWIYWSYLQIDYSWLDLLEMCLCHNWIILIVIIMD